MSMTIALAFVACASPAADSATATSPLANTRWQLIEIQSMDDTTLRPDDSGKYMLAFDDKGSVDLKADCNRMGGSYTFTPPSGLAFGPMRSTRAACPPGSLYDRISRDIPYVRSFLLKQGHLYLSLMADGGIYHFSPLP
jgi:para-nitrobenzyl esterase